MKKRPSDGACPIFGVSETNRDRLLRPLREARREGVDGEDRALSLRTLLRRDRQGAQGADQVKEELALVLTPQMIEDIRRRRHQRIEARKNWELYR